MCVRACVRPCMYVHAHATPVLKFGSAIMLTFYPSSQFPRLLKLNPQRWPPEPPSPKPFRCLNAERYTLRCGHHRVVHLKLFAKSKISVVCFSPNYLVLIGVVCVFPNSSFKKHCCCKGLSHMVFLIWRGPTLEREGPAFPSQQPAILQNRPPPPLMVA